MKAFTLLEVTILLVIFLMVALLVIPLSIDDTIQARNISRWKQAYSSLNDIPTSIKSISSCTINLQNFITAIVKDFPLKNVVSYKIKYMNGDQPQEDFIFKEIYNTSIGASIAFKWFETPKQDLNGQKVIGVIMYDVNGKQSPNVWGKDVFGAYIYENDIKPLGKDNSRSDIEFDCSKQGTGMYCSSYYLEGGAY